MSTPKELSSQKKNSISGLHKLRHTCLLISAKSKQFRIGVYKRCLPTPMFLLKLHPWPITRAVHQLVRPDSPIEPTQLKDPRSDLNCITWIALRVGCGFVSVKNWVFGSSLGLTHLDLQNLTRPLIIYSRWSLSVWSILAYHYNPFSVSLSHLSL